LVGFLHRHPILCLAFLTPGIVEYLSTSSPVLALVESPIAFLLFLAVNVGQYTAGALLIREAMIRWGKGWATGGLLALAYGITEEGLGDNTLFRNAQHADGILGVYGHFAGVNWVWSVGVLVLHVTVSMALPIVVLALALPETRGRSLLGRKGVAVALGAVAASTAFEMYLVLAAYHFWMGPALLVASVALIGGLMVGAYAVPAGLWFPAHPWPTTQPWKMAVVGFVFFPVALATEYGFAATPVPAALAIGVELVMLGMILEWIRRHIGQFRNESLVVHLAFGLVAWQAAFGVLLTLGLPYTLPLVAVALLFFLRLRKRYGGFVDLPDRPTPPPGALGEPPSCHEPKGVQVPSRSTELGSGPHASRNRVARLTPVPVR